MSRGSIIRFILRGRRSFWWVWKVTLLAPRIVNDISYVSRYQAWDSQCVAGAEFREFACSAHCKWRFICLRLSSLRFTLRGRRNIWWVWRMTLLAPRIVSDIAHVTRINHKIHFAWQTQVLVSLKGDFPSSAHFKRHMSRGSIMRFILRGRRNIWWVWRVTALCI